MDEKIKEELLQELEGASNFMRGMAFDPSLELGTKEALNERVSQIDATVKKYT